MTVLYFDCASGASGDMILAALIDAGAPVTAVREAVGALDLGAQINVSDVSRSGIRATKVDVIGPSAARRLPTHADLTRVLGAAPLNDPTKQRAVAIVTTLAEAEAKVHGTSLHEVHLHEAGNIDTIVDVVGAAAALAHFAPRRIVTSAIATGTGTVESEHGSLPIPGPAVAEMLKGAVLFGRGRAELVTPTAAAILASVTDEFAAMPEIRVDDIGYGAGARDLEWPNVLRVIVGREVLEAASDALVIETNIDDMSPELFLHVIESLLAAGAQDAWVTPIVMKKGRPAFTLSVLADSAARDRVIDVIYNETTTLGLRVTRASKDTLPREWLEVEVEGHPIRVKLGRRGEHLLTISPEYEDARRVARAAGIPLKEVYARAVKEASEVLRV